LKFYLNRHINFLRDVLIYTFSAFGGPQGHLAVLNKFFVQKKKYLTEKELLELNSFCQLLPGASSTQLIVLIAYKRGGTVLSFFTLLIWILPACILMSLLSFLVISNNHKSFTTSIFKYIQPLTVGFLIYSSIRAYKISINNKITFIIMIISVIITYVFFKTPWVFPLLIIAGGITTNLSDKRFPETDNKKIKKVKWINLWVFLFIFILAGFLSESARKQNWKHRKPYNLFENFYRLGSFVFGGGDILLPMMLDQYVVRPKDVQIQIKNPNTIKISKEDLLNGYGIVRAIPGPVFSISSYVGGLALSQEGKKYQLLGCVIGAISIFLPTILLLLFFYPIWQNLKRYVIFYRSQEGIYAVIVGVMFATVILLFPDFFLNQALLKNSINVLIITTIIMTLFFTKIPPQLIVLGTILLGWIF